MHGKRTEPARERRLYDPDSPAALRKELARGWIAAFSGIALLMAGLLFGAHKEYPFLAAFAGRCRDAEWVHLCEYPVIFDLAAGGLGFALVGGIGLLGLRYRPFRPTIFCERCIGAGWVRDLEPHDGRCPLCGWDRFTYRRAAFIPGPLGPHLYTHVEQGEHGTTLIERMRAHRSDLFEKWL